MKSSTGTKVFTGIPAGDRILVISGATEDKPVKVEYKLDTTWVLADTFTLTVPASSSSAAPSSA